MKENVRRFFSGWSIFKNCFKENGKAFYFGSLVSCGVMIALSVLACRGRVGFLKIYCFGIFFGIVSSYLLALYFESRKKRRDSSLKLIPKYSFGYVFKSFVLTLWLMYVLVLPLSLSFGNTDLIVIQRNKVQIIEGNDNRFLPSFHKPVNLLEILGAEEVRILPKIVRSKLFKKEKTFSYHFVTIIPIFERRENLAKSEMFNVSELGIPSYYDINIEKHIISELKAKRKVSYEKAFEIAENNFLQTKKSQFWSLRDMELEINYVQ